MSNLVNKILKFVNNDSPSTTYYKKGSNNSVTNNNDIPDTEWSITKITCATVPSEYDGKPVNIRLYIKTYNRLTFKRTSENKMLNAILKLIPWNRVWEVRKEFHANISPRYIAKNSN